MQELTPLQNNRKKGSKEPKSCFAWPKVFDEKTFDVQQFVNKQNDSVYLPKTSAENVHRGIRINAEYYRENILEGVSNALGPQTLDIPTGLRTIPLSARHPRMVTK